MKMPAGYVGRLLGLMTVCLTCLLAICLAQVDDEDIRSQARKISAMMQHDGTKRTLTVTNKNGPALVKKHKLLAILFWIDNGKPGEKLNGNDMNLLEVISQMYTSKGLAAGTCEVREHQEFAVKAGLKYTGMIIIFNRGVPTYYYGQRSTDTLVPYISKMLDHPLTTITSKTERKAYEGVQLPKVIVYVEKNSAEQKAVELASRGYNPMIQFHAVFNAKVAKGFHLKKVNTLQFSKPFEKTVTMKKKLTEKNIVEFINEHKRQRITKMRLENIHDVWAVDLKGYLVPIFAITKFEDGSNFFNTAKMLAKQFESHGNLTFTWIDPEPFPSMREYWKDAFRVDPMKPSVGVVDIHNQESTWFKKDGELKNSDSDHITLKQMITWLNKVLDGTIKLEPMNRQIRRKQRGEEATEEEEKKRDEL